MRLKITLITGFCFIVFSLNIYAQERIITVNNHRDIQHISQYCFYLEDPESSLTIDDLTVRGERDGFIPCRGRILNFGNTRSTIWIKFTMQNNTQDVCVAEVVKPHMGYVYLYEPDGYGKYTEKTTGAFIPVSQKEYRHNNIWFRLENYRQKAPATYYLKLTSPNKTAPLRIGTEKALFESKTRSDMFYGICFGILIMVMIYNLFIYFSIREKTYLLYLFYVLFIGLSNAILVGFTPAFLTNSVINIARNVQTIMAVSAIFLTIFSINFLETRKNTPRLHYFVYLFLAMEFMTIYFDLTQQYFYGSVLVQLFTMGSAIFLLPVSMIIYTKGYKVIRFYITAWVIGWLGIVSYILAINAILPFNFFTQNGVLIGSIFESILFSLALADKINFIKKEHEIAQKRTVEVLKENERLIIQQNERLEKLVGERTSEIEAKNIELRKYSENLENIVDYRTEQIKHANSELTVQNRRLEQYSYLTSHNIRGPVARLMGLLYLLKKENIIKEGQAGYIISKMEESTVELDSIIKDLSMLLDIDHDLSTAREYISLPEILENTCHILEVKIAELKPGIITDFSSGENIYGIRTFLYSIFYNLLSNALKYADAERKLLIHIRTESVNGRTRIIFSDNGQGMDMNLAKEKLFKPYQRLDLKKEGKGFGLFIVKTQIEAMEGTIEAESEVGKGTTFIIEIPSSPVS